MKIDPLILAITLPIAAGILCLFIPDKLKALAKFLGFIVSAAVFAASIYLFINKSFVWSIAGNSLFAIDNLSGFIGIAAGFFSVLIVIYSLGFVERNFGRYFGCLLMTLGSAFAAVYSINFISLMVFWGLLGGLLYLFINIAETDKAASSAKKALVIIGGTDVLMIFGVAVISVMTESFNIGGAKIELNGTLQIAAYLAILVAALAKAGAIPFYSWLPDVAQSAPAPVTAYLPASLDKLLGIYLLARISLDIFVMNDIIKTILLIIGTSTIIIAVLLALIQHDLKRLLGFHAVSQVGYMIVGIGTATPIGIAGGLFHMLNNAIYKSCLFLSSGNVEKSSGTTDLSKLGGLARYMPVTFASFLIASLSISGIPPFNGFFSKWMIYQGIIESASPKNPLWILWLVAAMFGSALTIASFMKLLHAVFLGRSSEELGDIKEARALMLIPIVTLAVLSAAFGIWAFSVPIKFFVAPILKEQPISFIGVWMPGLAAIVMVVGMILGLLIYKLLAPARPRIVEPFVGGEDIEKLKRVTGTEFYDTLKDTALLKKLYSSESNYFGDIYRMSRGAILFFTSIFKRLHNGALPTYMVWCILGMAAIFLTLFFK